MAAKRKTDKTEPNRITGAFNEAITFASDKAKGVAEFGTDSLEGARTAVRARPLTTAGLTLGIGALLGALAALLPAALFRDS
jgi:hypothetical protein